MAWEWVSDVSLLTLGVAGIAATYFSGERQREQTERLATDHRRQERLATAYVEVLDIAQQIGQWSQSLSPIFETNPPQPLPPLPPVATQSRAEALVLAFGSDVVLAALANWRESVRAIEHAHHQLTLAQRSVERHGMTGIDEPQVWKDLGTSLKPAEVGARRRLSDLIAAELVTRNNAPPTS